MPPRILRASLLLAGFALPLAAALDQNGDGISDIWSALHPQAGAPTADPDGDGQSNLAESIAGTNPTSAASRFEATAGRDAPGTITVRWAGVTGKHYRIESSSDLLTWAALPGDHSGAGSELASIVRLAGGDGDRAFWRIVGFDVDTDGDGLNDWEEAQLGTNPTSADTDGDGLPDAWEAAHGTNPTVAAAGLSAYPDTTPPPIPASLTAVWSAGAINLSWPAVSDLSGIVGYRIVRDGVEIGRTTTPAFRNAVGLQADVTYSYWVTALDGAGNESGRSPGASATVPGGTAEASGTDVNGDGWIETSYGFRLRASHPRVLTDAAHLDAALARMYGPAARDPYRRWFGLVRAAADGGAAVGPLNLALLYKATGERRYLDTLLTIGTGIPSRDLLYALDLVYTDVPIATLKFLQQQVAGNNDAFHYDSGNVAQRAAGSFGYHYASGISHALAYCGLLAYSAAEADHTAPANRLNVLGYLRAVNGELRPEGHFWRNENHIAGDPTFRGAAAPGTPGGMYDNLGYDFSEESNSIFALNSWQSLTGQPRHRGALHDEFRARFWHSMRVPYTEHTAPITAWCAHAGGQSGSGARVWFGRTDGTQPPAEAAALTAWLYRDGLMQTYVTQWRDLEQCGAPYASLSWWLLFNDDTLPAQAPSTLPTATYFSGPGLVPSRANWNPGATFALFINGDGISRRYEDAGAFLLHRRAPVVVHAGARIRFEPDNDKHHWYHIRSVSNNTLRIYDPAETLDERGRFTTNPPLVPSDNLGGQMFETFLATTDLSWPIDTGRVRRLTTPGASVSDLMDTANVLRFEHHPGDYTYTLADAAPAYSSKVELFERSYVHILPDGLLVFDRLRTADPALRRVWAAHTVDEPRAATTPVRGFGVADYGAATTLQINGALDQTRVDLLLPAQHTVRVRGGDTILADASVSASAPWSAPDAAPHDARWVELLASGSDMLGTLHVEGESAPGVPAAEDVTFTGIERLFESGLTPAVRTGEVQVPGAQWQPNQWANSMLRLSSPTRYAVITSNTADTLRVAITPGSSWDYRIVRAIGNTRTHFTRITRLSTADLDLAGVRLQVPHYFDTPDILGRVHSFSPHTDSKFDSFIGDNSLGRYTVELEAEGAGKETHFLVGFSLADAGQTPPPFTGGEGSGLAIAIQGARAWAFLTDRTVETAHVALPAEVNQVVIFGLEPGTRYRASLGTELLVQLDDSGPSWTSASGTLTLKR